MTAKGFVFGGTPMEVVDGTARASSQTIDIHASGPVDGMGDVHPEGYYRNLVISQKDGSIWRFRISWRRLCAEVRDRGSNQPVADPNTTITPEIVERARLAFWGCVVLSGRHGR